VFAPAVVVFMPASLFKPIYESNYHKLPDDFKDKTCRTQGTTLAATHAFDYP
jgi:hypothetical protein